MRKYEKFIDDKINNSQFLLVFNSITTFTVSSLSLPGQCRLASLIPCIQDSNQLYDFVVRLMFLLHANLPDDLVCSTSNIDEQLIKC